MADVRVEVRANVGDLAEQWDRLAKRSRITVPFVSAWWLDAIADTRSRIVCCWRGEHLIGGCALERDEVLGVERLRVLGRALSPDHFDLIAEPTERLAVVDALREWFCRPGQRIIDLEGTVDPSFVRAALPQPVRASVETIARFGSVSGGTVSRIDRQVKRVQRRLARDGIVIRRTPPDEIDGAIDALLRLHDLRFQGESLLIPHGEAFRSVARAGMASGEFRCYEARLDDQTVGVEAIGFVGGRCCTIQGGRDPDRQFRGVGLAILSFAIHDTIADGAHTVDLLRGWDRWKQDWGDDVGRLMRLRATNGTVARGAERGAAVGLWARTQLRKLSGS